MNTLVKLENGIEISSLSIISDTRGSVMKMIRSDDLEFKGFGECYFSKISPGVTKAWKMHRMQTQNISVPVGLIELVAFNPTLQDESKAISRIKLGVPDFYKLIRIPPNIWYGFRCISNDSALVVNCPDLPHDASDSYKKDQDDIGMPLFSFK